jgi:hypothetical protein
MDITNTMCRLSELSQWEIGSLVDNAPLGQFDFARGEPYIGAAKSGCWGTWVGVYGHKTVTYTEMMQLLGKTMKFTKSDLKTGMFVKYRNGGIRLVLDGIVTGDHWSSLLDFDSNLKCRETKERDIMTVYEVAGRGNITMYLNGESLRVIWERTEQTPVQKEMEELQAQITKLQEQAKVLQSKLYALLLM